MKFTLGLDRLLPARPSTMTPLAAALALAFAAPAAAMDFEPLDRILRVRAGRQVINWGESTFIAGGINVINPVDLAKLRTPGSELKEALLPTTGVWASQELTKSVTVEAFVLTNFDKIRID